MKMKLAAVFMGTVLTWQAQALTDAQKNELYHRGTLSVFNEQGSKTGHFEVHFMPGSSNIADNAKKEWLAALDLMDDFVDKEHFWREEFIGSFNSGIRYMRSGIKNGVFKVPADFENVLEENHAVNGTFGGAASKLKNWLEFSFTVAGRVLTSVWGVGAGAIYAIVMPSGRVLYRPVAAATRAVVGGTLWPVLAYSWNGVAWSIVKNKNEPKAGDMTVTFVPEHISPSETHESTLNNLPSNNS